MSRKKKILIAVGAVAVVIGGAVIFLPQIAGGFVPGFVESKAHEQILGGVRVKSASLSWSGPQKLTGVQVLDPDNKEVAIVDVDASVGLLSLARGSMDLGNISLAGKALIVRDAKGITNLQKAIAPRNAAPTTTTTTSGGKQPATTIPAGLKVKTKITNLDVTFADESAVTAGAQYSMVELPNLSGEAQLAVGQPVTIALKSDVNANATAKSAAPGVKGTISVNGTVDGLIAADGTVQPDKAKADVKVRGASVPVAVVDLLAGQNGRLAKGLGQTMDLASDVKGDYNAGTVTFSISTTNHAAVSGTLKVANGVLTSDAPITAAMPGAALVELVPSLRDSLKSGSGLEITTFPDATLKIESIAFKLPKKSLDLRGSGVVAQLMTAPMQGTLKIEGQPTRKVEITGLDARVAALDFGGDVRAIVKCNAHIDGQTAGTIDTDFTVGGLLDANGAFKGGMPGKLDGRASVQGASSDIIEPFVKAYKIMPREDIGKTLNVDVIARTPQDPKRGGYDVEIKVGSDRVSVDGAFAVTETNVKSIARPLSARVLSAGAIASRYMPAGGWQLRPTGAMDVVLKDVDIPFVKDAKTGASSMNLSGATLGFASRIFGFEVMPPAGTTNPTTLSVKALDFGMAMAPKASPRVTVSGDLNAGKDAFGIEADLSLQGLIQASGIDTSAMAPMGKIAIKNLPTSLASMFNPAAKPGETAMDLGAIARDAIGPSVTVTTNLSAEKGKTQVHSTVAAANATTNLDAELSGPINKPTELAVKGFTGEINLQPSALDSHLRTFMPDLRERPQLVDVSQLKFAVEPVTIPLAGDQKLDVSKLGTINAKVQAPGRILVRGLTRTGDDGKPIAVAPAGVENLELTVKAPASIGVAAGKVDATFKTRLLSQDAGDGTLANVSGNAQIDLAAPPAETKDAKAKPAETSRLVGLTADVKITGVATAALDRLNATPGMLSGLLGDSLSADVTAKIAGADAKSRTIVVEATPKAPRIAASKPIRVTLAPDKIVFAEDTKIDVQLDPAFANGYIFKPDANGKTPARLLKATPVSLTISKMTLSRDSSGEGKTGPLMKGVFELQGSATAASAAMELADGQQVTLGKTTATVNAKKDGGPLAFDVQVDSGEVKGDKSTQAVEKVTFSGTIENLADANGKPNKEGMIVNAAANVPAFPTAVLDALANQNGLLNDALGPIVSANLKADRVQLGTSSKTPGALDISMQSPRASMKLKGTVQNGVFTNTTPAEVTFVEVTPELSGRISKNIPFIGAITKSKELKPGIIKAENLTVPMDGDLTKLNGDVTIDLGEALVAPGGIVNELLNVKIPALTGALDKTGLSEAKKVGQRLKPVPVSIRQGVMAYQDFKLPLGEFEIENSGSIDLAHKQVDAVVWIPLGRLATEAVPGLNRGVNGIPVLGDLVKGSFDEFTMIPFEIKGNMGGKISRDFSASLFANRVGKTIKNGAGLQDALKGIGDLFKRDKDKK